MRGTATSEIRAALMALGMTAAVGAAGASELRAGAASADITPDRPVVLAGHKETKVTALVRTPLVANALALESRDGGKVLGQAVLVACDLVTIPDAILRDVRDRLRGRIPDFDPEKLILSATHCHNAPVMEDGYYTFPDDAMKPREYAAFLSGRVADAAVAAWESRKPSKVGWGLGHAVVARARRMTYADGRAVMYGPTDGPDFRGVEGPEDHDVDVLFIWDSAGKLVATAVNVACPSQIFDSETAIDADFWHPVRETLRARRGADLVVLGWAGAGGDQSPRTLYNKRAEDRMRELRGRSRVEELGARIVAAWDEAYEGARNEPIEGASLVHKVDAVDLPPRLVTDAEVAAAEAEVAKAADDPDARRPHQAILDRARRERAGEVEPYRAPLHVLRLGDVAIATNPFELFTQYGIQIKARSKALQTFLIQLAGPGSYVPTGPALRAGGYSTGLESNRIGPDGGQRLVDWTVEAVDGLWPE